MRKTLNIILLLILSSHASVTQAQDVLPIPQAPFKGQIGLAAKDSKPDFPKLLTAPKGAPNVVIVMLDDVGFGTSSTFGGPINTPTLERLAKNRVTL